MGNRKMGMGMMRRRFLKKQAANFPSLPWLLVRIPDGMGKFLPHCVCCKGPDCSKLARQHGGLLPYKKILVFDNDAAGEKACQNQMLMGGHMCGFGN